MTDFEIVCADGSDPIILDPAGTFTFHTPAPPNDGRCTAGWGHPEERCQTPISEFGKWGLCAACEKGIFG